MGRTFRQRDSHGDAGVRGSPWDLDLRWAVLRKSRCPGRQMTIVGTQEKGKDWLCEAVSRIRADGLSPLVFVLCMGRHVALLTLTVS